MKKGRFTVKVKSATIVYYLYEIYLKQRYTNFLKIYEPLKNARRQKCAQILAASLQHSVVRMTWRTEFVQP